MKITASSCSCVTAKSRMESLEPLHRLEGSPASPKGNCPKPGSRRKLKAQGFCSTSHLHSVHEARAAYPRSYADQMDPAGPADETPCAQRNRTTTAICRRLTGPEQGSCPFSKSGAKEQEVHHWRRFPTRCGAIQHEKHLNNWRAHAALLRSKLLPCVLRGERGAHTGRGPRQFIACADHVIVLEKLTPEEGILARELATGAPIIYRLNADATVASKPIWRREVRCFEILAVLDAPVADTALDARFGAGGLRRGAGASVSFHVLRSTCRALAYFRKIAVSCRRGYRAAGGAAGRQHCPASRVQLGLDTPPSQPHIAPISENAGASLRAQPRHRRGGVQVKAQWRKSAAQWRVAHWCWTPCPAGRPSFLKPRAGSESFRTMRCFRMVAFATPR